MAKPEQKKPAAEGSEQVSPPSPAPAPPPKASLDEKEAAEHAEAMADKAKREAESAKTAAAPEPEFVLKREPGATSSHGPLKPELAAAIAAAKPALVHAPAPAPQAKPTSATYKVWSHGTLQRNGKTYAPGDTLTLDPAEAAKIPCLERV